MESGCLATGAPCQSARSPPPGPRRYRQSPHPEPRHPLTENCCCRTRLLDKADLRVTRINALTSGHYTGAMLPIDFETDAELLQVVLTEIGLTEPPDARLIWIHNTLDLREVECGSAYWDEARSRDDLEVLTDPRPLPFDAAGNLPDDVATLSPAAGHR